MANIIEAGVWQDNIPLISRADRVEGGRSGLVNVQTEMLADRTQYLKNQIEQTNVLLKSGELPFSSIDDAQAAINQGKLTDGAIFSIRSTDPLVWVAEYRSQAGKPIPTGKKILANNAITLTIFPSENDRDGTIAGIAATTSGQTFRVISGDNEYLYRNDNNNPVLVSRTVSRSDIKRVDAATQRLFVAEQMLASAMSGVDIVMSDGIQKLNAAMQIVADAIAYMDDESHNTDAALTRINTAIQVALAAVSATASGQEVDNNRLTNLINTSIMAAELYKLDGLDTVFTGGGGNADATQVVDGVYAFPDPARVVRIDISSPRGVPSAKADGEYQGRCKIDVDGISLSAFSTIAVQGSSSAGYPKKNLTIGFYTDADYSNELNLKIGDGLAFSEWVYKANYIDTTHSRNVLGYRLWAQMQNVRDAWPRREVDFYYAGKTGADAIDTGATGIPKGYPCVVYINSEFYGIGDLMIGKKRSNYNIAKNIPEQIYLEFQNCDIIKLDTTNPGIVEVKAPSVVNDTVNNYFNKWRAFARLPQAEFAQQLPDRLDKVNVADYYILMMFICGVDCFNKNMLFITWDAMKWFCMPYDLDTTFGLNPFGTEIAYGPTLNPLTEGMALKGNQEFWGKIRGVWGSDINARYAQLRNAGVLSVNNVSKIMTEMQSKFTIDMFRREFEKWPALPSKNITSNDQVLNWLSERMVWLDNYFSYTK